MHNVRASYWFLPSIFVLIGLLFATATVWPDHHAEALPFQLPQSFTNTQTDGARSSLAVTAQSIIGVTGVMFSMTVVAASFSSGNFDHLQELDKKNGWCIDMLPTIGDFITIETQVFSIWADNEPKIKTRISWRISSWKWWCGRYLRV